MAVVALRSVRDQTMVLWTDPQRQGWNSQQPVRLSQNRDGRTIILCIYETFLNISAGSLDDSTSASRGEDEDPPVPGGQRGE